MLLAKWILPFVHLIPSYLLRDSILAILTSVYCLDIFFPLSLCTPISMQTWQYFSHLREKKTLLTSLPHRALDLGLSFFFFFTVKLVKSIAYICYLFSNSLFSFLLRLLFYSPPFHWKCFIKSPNNIYIAKYSSQCSSSSSVTNVQHSTQLITVSFLKHFVDLAFRIPHLQYLLLPQSSALVSSSS